MTRISVLSKTFGFWSTAAICGLAFSLHAPAARAQARPPAPVPVPPSQPATAPAAATAPTVATETAVPPPPADVPPTSVSPAPGSPVATSSAEERAEPEQDKKKKKKDKHAEAAVAEGDVAKDGKRKDKDRGHPGEVRTAAGRLRLKGRVFAQAALESQTVDAPGSGGEVVQEKVNSLDLSVESVRIGLEYQAPLRWITAVAEMELTSRVSLRDGFVQARDKHWSVRAGQFKIPVSAIAMESPWVLPVVRRGLIHNLLTDWLDVAGRRPGVLVSYRTGAEPRVRVSAGAFQGAYMTETPAEGDRDTEVIMNESMTSQSYVGRVDVEFPSVAVGAYFEQRVGSPQPLAFEHYGTAGLDVVLDHALPGGGVRAWGELMGGESWYEDPDKVQDGDDALFVAARLIAGYRFGGTADEAPYIEPFAFGGVFDPDLDVVSDKVFEYGLGVAAGFWRRARVTLEGEVNQGQRNLPITYLAGEDPDRLSLLLQAGVAW